MWNLIKLLVLIWLLIGLNSCDNKLKEKYRGPSQHNV